MFQASEYDCPVTLNFHPSADRNGKKKNQRKMFLDIVIKYPILKVVANQ
jgi:hypothetical protein